jgi:hypothetical protein
MHKGKVLDFWKSYARDVSPPLYIILILALLSYEGLGSGAVLLEQPYNQGFSKMCGNKSIGK